MGPIVGSAIASGVGNLFSGLFNSGMSQRAAKYSSNMAYKTAIDSTNLQNEANWKLAQYQNDYNRSMWQAQNEYNSPSAQMQRFKDAGLNPALMYSQGDSGNAGTPPSAADFQPDYSRYQSGPSGDPRFMLPQLGNILKDVVGTYSAMQQLRKNDLDAEAQSIQNSYLGDSLNARIMNQWNKFYWSGGIPGINASSGIADALYSRLRGSADFTNARVATERLQPELIREIIGSTKASRYLNTVRSRDLMNTIYEYDQTEKKWTQTLGRWKKPLSFIGNMFGGILQSYLGGRSFGSGFGRSSRSRHSYGSMEPNYDFYGN